MSRYGERTRVSEAVSGLGKAPSAGIGYGVATGGTSSSITVSSVAFTMLTFTAAGTLTVTKAGLIDLLVIGGGSSGQAAWFGNGRPGAAGGGAGGALEATSYFDIGTYAVVVGAGGADPADVFEFFLGNNSFVGQNLGSGSASGRGGMPSWNAGGNTARVPQQKGFDGFIGASSDGGGGGGQGGAATTRNGANGFDWSLWRGEAPATNYYGGGGGGLSSGNATGTGGLGGGATSGTGLNAVVNKGGGGAGGDGGNATGGGSGIVFARFKV